jgi:histidinol-phosphate aminotransferase
MLDPSRVRELATRLNGSAPLVIDEAYVDFADNNCLDLIREFDNLIITRTLSKSYALAGIRFGFAVARPEIIAGLTKVKDSYNCDAISIAAATAALADQDHLRQSVARIQATRQRMTESLRRFGFHVPDSQANFVWCTGGPAPARRLYEQLKARGILVRFMAYPASAEGMRISVGNDAEIDRLLEELRSLI